MNEVIIKDIENYGKIVKISSVGNEFDKWLRGQTIPVVYEDENPYDWAYHGDYIRFINNLPVID
ncbi:MAG: hypothetical protein M1320_02825 [Patescibacteria group bacterium]|nr:hypothetical protein [Patescibacteria group bacterium]